MAERTWRWEREVDRVRAHGPAWLDVERLPWWLWLGMGIAWAGRGAYQLATADHWWGRLSGVVLLLLVAPAQLLLARRLGRGRPPRA